MSRCRLVSLLLSGSLILGSAAGAADSAPKYNNLSPQALQERLTAGQPTNLVDIQVAEEFAKHHITGAVPTYAYPVKSADDTAKLDAVVARLKANSDPVVIVCPRGAGGATRTYDYLLAQGIAPERLLILEKGQEGWACAPLTEGQ
jgi:rhodanese-related sulfurtransferase